LGLPRISFFSVLPFGFIVKLVRKSGFIKVRPEIPDALPEFPGWAAKNGLRGDFQRQQFVTFAALPARISAAGFEGGGWEEKRNGIGCNPLEKRAPTSFKVTNYPCKFYTK